jgi:hypothetical protein
MKLKIFTFRYSVDEDGFDDRPMQQFLKDKVVLAVHEHFFVYEQVPTWVLLISYRYIDRLDNARMKTGRLKDLRAELSEDEQRVYNALRRWRNDRARREGPTYC